MVLENDSLPAPVFLGYLETDCPSSRSMSSAEPVQKAADQALLAEVAAGNQQAFAALYDRLSGPLYSLCLRMLGSEAEAEDALQESFMVIWRRASAYDESRSAVFTWAVQITRCKIIDHLRSRDRRLRIVTPFEPLAGDNAARDVQMAGGGDAADAAQAREGAGQMRQAVGELSPEQSQVIELAFFGDLTHHEISARLGQPLGTIKARIRRALIKLRERMSGGEHS